MWLTGLLNLIIELELIPPSLKQGITIPVFKGGGKDPLNVNSYRGITLNSVISKIMELLILNRVNPVLMEAGFPHPNQSAYRSKVSCADAIFATQEVVNRYLQEGSQVYMCLYDLQKAFDSVEFPVLLRNLFDIGINSKTWRILYSWYTDCQSSVRLGRHVSHSYTMERGVRQGSILSPLLFLFVMDPLLRQLQSSSVGTSINNMYAGGYIHADDIRTLAGNVTSLESQISTVERFTADNFLTLNASKCEIIVFRKSTIQPYCADIQVGGNCFPVKDEVRCLGYLWNSNLSSLSMIQDRIKKARRAFFQFGSIYAFQGCLSPLSSSSIVQCCVYPVLFYGIENWVMSAESLKILECFQGELAKRILKLPKWYSNSAACVMLGWNSMHSNCTIRKLRFLHRVITNKESLCYRAYSAMVDDVEALSIVRECRELEERYNSNFATQILSADDSIESATLIREAGDFITRKDRDLLLIKSSKSPYLCSIAESVGWKKLWDIALDHGQSVVKGVRNLGRIIAYPDHATSDCPLCDVINLNRLRLPEHIIRKHTNNEASWDELMDSLITMDPWFSNHIACLTNIF